MSRCGGRSGASATAASCGGAARVQAAAAANVAVVSRTVHASAPVAVARAEHAGASTKSFVPNHTENEQLLMVYFYLTWK